jgi:hypothetical protein
MNQPEFNHTFWLTSSLVLTALVVFSIFYNRHIARLERRGSDRGYMAFIVAFGVFITLSGINIIIAVATTAHLALQICLISLAAFTASGLPMIWGSVTRHTQQRYKTDQAIQRLPDELFTQKHEIRGEPNGGQTKSRGVQLETGNQSGYPSEPGRPEGAGSALG